MAAAACGAVVPVRGVARTPKRIAADAGLLVSVRVQIAAPFAENHVRRPAVAVYHEDDVGIGSLQKEVEVGFGRQWDPLVPYLDDQAVPLPGHDHREVTGLVGGLGTGGQRPAP